MKNPSKKEELIRKLRKENRYAILPLKYIKTAMLDGAPEEMIRRRLDLAFMDNGAIVDYDNWKDSIGLSVGYSGHLIIPQPSE